MDKRELVDSAARRSTLTRDQVRQALQAILETIAEALASGDCVVLAAFGRFEMQEYPERKVRRFGQEGHFDVTGRQVPVFKPSSTLRKRVRGES